MIVYYDVMLVDDDIVMNNSHSSRRRRLQELITCDRGVAIISRQKTVDFFSSKGPERLRTLFATAITHRWEGLVIKPSDEPYFSSRQTSRNGPARGWIKLKKDYIPGLGDTADFAVVGAGYDASRAARLKCPTSKWTHFHLGCLRNQKEVKEKKARPYFMVVGAIDANLEITKHLNQHGQYCALPFGSLRSHQDPFIINISQGIPTMGVVFRKPFVLDMVGAGFDKEGNRDYYTLRFPRAIKVHSDRDWKDSISFDELQQVAKASRTIPADTKAEVAGWEQQLDQVDRGTKESHVPWDLSDDDIDHLDVVRTARPALPPSSRADRRRSSVAPPMIRMDTGEMTTKEQRLDSGEVVERPSQHSHLSNWSDSNLPTPPKSSPAQAGTPIRGRKALAAIQSSLTDQLSTPYSRQALSSVPSTNTTDQSRKRSAADHEETPEAITSKRQCSLLPTPQTKVDSADNVDDCQKANTHAAQDVHKPKEVSTKEPFLVPKLPVGTAEALRSKTQPRVIKDMDRTSPDRHTTEDEASTRSVLSTQQSLIDDWQLQDTEPQPLRKVEVPDLWQSEIILSKDVSGMPYLKEDLLTGKYLKYHYAHKVFLTPTATANFKTPSRCTEKGRGQQIVVLVEGRRLDSTLEMMKFLVGRIPNDRSQIIWVFDWRLVEDKFARNVKDDGTLIEKRLVGCFWYHDDGDLRWLSVHREVFVVPQENIQESKNMSAKRLVRLGAIEAACSGGSS